MGRKNEKSEFRDALLCYAELYEVERQSQMALYEAQEKQRVTYAAVSEQRQRVLELWKKVNPSACPGGYVLLPDGRIASIDTGSVLLWKPMQLD